MWPVQRQNLLFSGYVQTPDGLSNASVGSSVSASTAGIGVANNSMNDGDNLRINFVDTATVKRAGITTPTIMPGTTTSTTSSLALSR